MATSDDELENEVRGFTGIDTAIVDSEDFATVLSDAKRHIKIRRSLTPEQIDWYNEPVQEEALNWATKLFLKTAAGELDAQGIQVGAIDHNTLLAKNDDEVTTWYRNMERAMKQISPETSYGHVSTERRVYGSDGETGGSTGTDFSL
jgi:hypothetical protein